MPARRKTHFKPSKFLKEFLQIPLEKLGVTNDGKKIDPNGRGGSAY